MAFQKYSVEEVEIELPLKHIDKSEVLGQLFIHMDTSKEKYHDAVFKFQTWIMNYADAQVKDLQEFGDFSDAEVEAIRKKFRVVSPLTLTLYLQAMQMEQFIKMTDSEKERWMLERMPDRFKARFKGNASCRNAREVSADEEDATGKPEVSSAERAERLKKMSFVEFLREFGSQIRAELGKNQSKE